MQRIHSTHPVEASVIPAMPSGGLTPDTSACGHAVFSGADHRPAPQAPRARSVRCFWCDRVHVGRHPLAVCFECAARYETLRSLGMHGSFCLDARVIDAVLTRAAPGNFALGYMDGDAFSVFYVGRSDSDVRERLHEWVGMPSASERYGSNAKAPWASQQCAGGALSFPSFGRVGNGESSYTHFAYSYAATSAGAFEKELRNFHDFGGFGALDNPCEPEATAC